MGRLNYFDENASLGFDHLDLELVEEFSNTFEDLSKIFLFNSFGVEISFILVYLFVSN